MDHDNDGARSDDAVMPISTADAERLYAALSLDQPVDPSLHDIFRHGMFAGRIRAAKFGREDAVIWAREWLAALDAEQSLSAAALQAHAPQPCERQETFGERRADGVAENPRYQAFLDTLEQPGELKSNAKYMIWVSDRIAEHKRQPGVMQLANEQAYQKDLTAYMRRYADNHLASRLLRTAGNAMDMADKGAGGDLSPM